MEIAQTLAHAGRRILAARVALRALFRKLKSHAKERVPGKEPVASRLCELRSRDVLVNRPVTSGDSPIALRLARSDLDPTAAGFARLRKRIFASAKGGALSLDLGAIVEPSTEELAVLTRALDEAEARGISVKFAGWTPQLIDAMQNATAALVSEEAGTAPHESVLERVGEKALRAAADWEGWGKYLYDALNAIVVDPLVGRPWKWDAITEQMYLIGVRGTVIVVFISLLVGIVLALNGAEQLRQFGAAIFVANLVGVSVAREMGPLITAVIIAGRSGSAIAAELGTMVVSEEIDAMRTMALEPNRYLLAPRVIALILVTPCLTILSDLLAMVGGYMVGVSMGLGASNYLRQTAQSLMIGDVVTGLVKSVIFAALIGLISCYEGLRVSGGAEGVGAATTNAVVSSIISCIAADAVFTLIFYFTN
jgi:phospholipid/cholesterol/gamma-HCH transport system permease protein